ncbi:uncharacterized protein LOC120788820 isoform X1 [Xiphias gladius]|uniref:uncharacterized protein LOC120788820 isoform X1 n=1 Tax=Xiphias gladius TaxID=8245 RepID=UPI001A987139|nr:uncharacterized protein LOC120788820 isoform X1 [Xiphias gladius]
METQNLLHVYRLPRFPAYGDKIKPKPNPLREPVAQNVPTRAQNVRPRSVVFHSSLLRLLFTPPETCIAQLTAPDFRNTMNRRFPSILEVYYQSNEWAGVYGIRERDHEAWSAKQD